MRLNEAVDENAFVSLRTLFAMIIALAVLLAPAISHGDALAAVPHHDMEMMEGGHCHTPAPRKDRHAHDMSCCTAMSVGIAPTATAAADEASDQVAPASAALAALHCPFLGELATPPPRSL
jgi:hypothetical protein